MYQRKPPFVGQSDNLECCSPYVKDQFLDLGTIMKSFLRSVKTFRTPDLVYLVPIIWLDCVHKYNHCIRRVVVPW